MTHTSIENLTSFALRAKGDVPPPLVGATISYYQAPGLDGAPPTPLAIVYGGRRVSTRRVSSSLYILNLDTLVWEKIFDSEDQDVEPARYWPPPRYFHTANMWHDKLIIFGGMGYASASSQGGPSPLTASSGTSAGSSQGQLEQPCVLADVHIFDCTARRWLPLAQNGVTSATPEPDSGFALSGGTTSAGPIIPTARYAHLSAVSRDRLYIMGGQNLDNDYVAETSAFDLRTRQWVGSVIIPNEARGSYRSVAVSSPKRAVNLASLSGSPPGTDHPADQLTRLPVTITEPGGGGDTYVFSNSNFTDVRRELQVLAADNLVAGNPADMAKTDLTNLMKGAPALPPGLRFPCGAIIGHHLIICGTYLSASVQQFSTWSLDLWTWRWQKIEAAALESGSWNKAVLWEDRSRLVVFGNRSGNSQDDYEHRSCNFGNIAFIELEVFGIYGPPPQVATLQQYQTFALQSLQDALNADFELVCEDGRAIKCARTVLQQRWPWFAQEFDKARKNSQEIVELAMHDRDDDPPSVALSSARLTPRQLHLAEPYPVCLAVLQYFYTESLLTTLQHRPPVLSSLLMLSRQYDLPELGRLVVHAMHERLSEAHALHIYEIATLCGCVSLQLRALKIVLQQRKYGVPTPAHRRGASASASTVPLPGGSSMMGSPATLGGPLSATRPRAATDGASNSMPRPTDNEDPPASVPTEAEIIAASFAQDDPAAHVADRGTTELQPATGNMISTPLATVSENVALATPPPPPVLIKSPRHFRGGLRTSVSSPGLSGLMRAHSRNSSSALPSIMIDPEAGATAVEIEYALPSGRALQRTASLTTVHHFGEGRPGSGRGTARTGSSAGSARHPRFGRETSERGDISSPSLTSHSDGFTVSTLHGTLLTPGDSPMRSGWPSGWRSPTDYNETILNAVLDKQPRSDLALPVVIHRGPIASKQDLSATSNAAVEDSLTRKGHMTSSGATTPRPKAHRPPVINTQIARLEFKSVSKVAASIASARAATPLHAEQRVPSPVKSAIGSFTDSVASEKNPTKKTPAKAAHPSAAVIERRILDDLATPPASKRVTTRRRLLSEPDKVSKVEKARERKERSRIGALSFGRFLATRAAAETAASETASTTSQA